MLHRRVVAFTVATLTAAAPCAGTMSAGATATAKRKGPAVLRVLVTNDDGAGSDGADALVEALRKQPKVKVTVVVPLNNKSGTGDQTSPAPHAASDATTKSGYKAVAVDGFPADSVNYALDTLKVKPDLVMSGINLGQNVGPAVNLSGTVGAAKAAVRRGVAALAVSQGVGSPVDYPAAAREAINWLKSHRNALTKAKGKGATKLANLNVPTCTAGTVRGLLKNVTVATGGDFIAAQDCTSTLKNPPDDVTALNNGYATLSDVTP